MAYVHECVVAHWVRYLGTACAYTIGMNSDQTRVKEETMSIDRSEVSRALAKAIAYKNCGKNNEACLWARKLVELLECAEILA